ncbi:MAG: hypothetical protein P8L46_12505 [Acidimicrobiales bacterium]|nr:hypothetical protein [Acidimicrobiales bacterium]MDG2218852.1 hypothetical protein [Acidimicrobiales bacterium]
MSVERNQDWGEVADVPDGIEWFSSDRAASVAISTARRANKPLPQIGLTGGDLYQTLGGGFRSTPPAKGTTGTKLSIDLGAALLDGKLHWFLAHLVARRSWLRGPVVVAANAAHLGSWNIAPKAHPGDGRLDTLEATLAFSDRLKARSRLPLGTHVPHPDITMRRSKASQWEFKRGMPIYLDGTRTAVVNSLSIRLEPDALDVWI